MRLGRGWRIAPRYGEAYEQEGNPDGMQPRTILIIFAVELLACIAWFAWAAMAGAFAE